MALTVAVLESLFTANIKDFEKKADAVDKTQKALDKADPTVKVGAETTGALADMVKVQTSAKKITDTAVVSQVDADISKAQKNATKIKTNLEVLASLPTDVTVTADIAKATATLEKVETRLAGLRGARAEMVVVADVAKAEAGIGQAEAALKRVDGDTATIKVDADTSRAKADLGALGDEGSKAGEDAGEGLSAGILAAIIALPVAGAIVGVGAAIGKSLMDGLQVEVRSDALMAKTGLDAKTIAPIARASGEAYANNFGGSIAENMDTARIAIQGGLLDVDGTAQDSQSVIESLSGVADILGEEIPAVSRATAQILKTGLAVDAQGAFDLIVKGAQAGVNKSEDLLDTFNEYGTSFRKLGLEGPQALGLLSQAIQGGARDSDQAADALKEFGIRATDMSKTSVAAMDTLGLNAAAMADVFTTGGPKASAALGMILDKIRGIKDPSDRSATAIALFGAMAEDMDAAFGAMDLSTAVDQLGSVEGAAKSAIDTLGDNTAGKLATAQRNIEVAADGIKGALATAFSPQIEGFATFVTENRAAVMGFLLDMANGAIDAGRALANAAASGVEGFGDFVGTAGPAMMGFLDAVVSGAASVMQMIPGMGDEAQAMVDSYNKATEGALASFKATDEGASKVADTIRTNLITNGLDPAQAKLNAVAIPMVAQAKLHDASVSLAKDLDSVGYAGNGARLKLDTLNGTVKTNTHSGKLLDTQIRKAVKSLDAEALAGARSGESQSQLTSRYESGRQALVKQLTQMGYTGAEAKRLADKYRAIPGKAETKASLDKVVAEADIRTLQGHINDIRQGKKPGIDANTAAGKAKIRALQAEIDALRGKSVTITTTLQRLTVTQTRKSRLPGDPMADGGHVQAGDGLDRQSRIAPGGANILWAEPETGWETYISGKPSQRARNIRLLEETARRFGLAVLPTTARSDGTPPPAVPTSGSRDPFGDGTVRLDDHTIRALGRELAARPTVLDGARVSRSVDSRLVPR